MLKIRYFVHFTMEFNNIETEPVTYREILQENFSTAGYVQIFHTLIHSRGEFKS